MSGSEASVRMGGPLLCDKGARHEWHTASHGYACSECGLYLTQEQFKARHNRLEAALEEQTRLLPFVRHKEGCINLRVGDCECGLLGALLAEEAPEEAHHERE